MTPGVAVDDQQVERVQPYAHIGSAHSRTLKHQPRQPARDGTISARVGVDYTVDPWPSFH